MVLNKVWIGVVVAIILAASGLGYAFLSTESNRRVNEGLDAEIEAINSDLTSLRNKLTTLNSSLTQLSQGLGKEDSELQNKIVTIQANVSSLVTQTSNLKTDVSTIQKNMTNVQTDITKLQANVTSLSTQISNVKSDISAIQNDVFTIETDIAKLQSNVTVFSTEIANIQNDISTILTLIADLQSRVASLEARVSTLESKRPLVIRIWFLSIEPDNVPVTGKDYLFDVKLSWGLGIESYVYGRTGHSRFIAPNYLDLSVNRTLMGKAAEITIYAYWHIDDLVIDIDPDPVHSSSIDPRDPSGRYLTLTYTIGATPLQGTVDGNADGHILDSYDAKLTYKIETLP